MTEENEIVEEEVELKVVRLVSGVDIIGYCVDQERSIDISGPMEIVINREEESDIFLRPWLPIEIMDYNFCSISYADILTFYYPKEAFLNYYIRLSNNVQEIIDEANEKDDVIENPESTENNPEEPPKKILH